MASLILCQSASLIILAPDCFHPTASLPSYLLQVVEDDSGVLEVVMAAAEVETVAHQLVAGIGR